MNLALFVRPPVCPSVCSQRSISELAHQFFLNFCMKLDCHKIKKSDEAKLSVKSSNRQEGPRSPKNSAKMRF